MTATTPQRFPLLTAGFFGLTGVILGALGAHRLQPLLADRGMTQVWETGARYHMYHAVALLGVAALMRGAAGSGGSQLAWAARCWSLGVLLFSGSLYWYAVGGPQPLVYVTPIGGLALVAGWGCVLVAAFAEKPAAK